jgi:O-antigen ligase
VTDRSPKIVYIPAAVLCSLGILYLAYSQPGYFTTETYLGGLLFLEFVAVAVWMYRRVFFPLIMMSFLLAGVDLPVGTLWTAARWFFLCLGALVGAVLMLKERNHRFGLFHIVAAFAALETLVSATVSQYPRVALLKALSFVLLFLYAATGARLAVTGRQNRFFTGLLTGCEVFVGGVATFYALGIEAMGNPNSLGAVMGVVGAPLLFWGVLLEETPFVHFRRLVLYGVCMYLTFQSHSRAGLAAALVSCGLLGLALRKYKMAVKAVGIVVILVAAGAIFQPEAVSNSLSYLTSSVVYKGNTEGSLLASRQSPWQSAVDSIRDHFWFGTGLGTAENSNNPTGRGGMFSSSTDVAKEYGNSYLSIVAGTGVIGAVPFSLLLLLLLGKIFRTITWLLKTRNVCHPAVPLAMVMVAGLLHAGFEDWLFAPGYYVCVLFWSLAFILVDMAPSSDPRFAFARRFRGMPQALVEAAPSR